MHTNLGRVPVIVFLGLVTGLPAMPAWSQSIPSSSRPAASAPASPPAEKWPVPSAASRQKAAAEVKQMFGAQMSQVVMSADRLALANNMVQAARTSSDPAVRYALLTQAKDLALRGFDLPAALRIADVMAESFAVTAVEARADVILNYSDITAGNGGDVCRVIDQAVGADNYKVAQRLIAFGADLAKRTHDDALAQRFSEKSRLVNEASAARSYAQQASARLEKDPSARAVVGKFLCFTKNDWDTGLPLLAKSNHAALSKLAAIEVAKPSDDKAIMELADNWWDLAEKESSLSQQNIRTHASVLYSRIVARLTGLDQDKAKLRLAKAPPPAAPVEITAGPPVGPASGAPSRPAATATVAGSAIGGKWVLSWESDGEKHLAISLEADGTVTGGDFHERSYRFKDGVVEIMSEDGTVWLYMTYDPAAQVWLHKYDREKGGCGIPVQMRRAP